MVDTNPVGSVMNHPLLANSLVLDYDSQGSYSPVFSISNSEVVAGSVSLLVAPFPHHGGTLYLDPPQLPVSSVAASVVAADPL